MPRGVLAAVRVAGAARVADHSSGSAWPRRTGRPHVLRPSHRGFSELRELLTRDSRKRAHLRDATGPGRAYHYTLGRRRVREENRMRAEQTVSEMVVESLARQAEVLSEGSGKTFEEAFAEVLETPSGRRLGELADGPHRHERASEWQAGLIADREAQRPAHLRERVDGRNRQAWLERYMEWVGGTDGREEYHAFLRERFASVEG